MKEDAARRIAAPLAKTKSLKPWRPPSLRLLRPGLFKPSISWFLATLRLTYGLSPIAGRSVVSVNFKRLAQPCGAVENSDDALVKSLPGAESLVCLQKASECSHQGMCLNLCWHVEQVLELVNSDQGCATVAARRREELLPLCRSSVPGAYSLQVQDTVAFTVELAALVRLLPNPTAKSVRCRSPTGPILQTVKNRSVSN